VGGAGAAVVVSRSNAELVVRQVPASKDVST
jgi:hypothetical protein